MADRPRVLVVGAGIVGTSIAWHLARSGAPVTIVEADVPGGVATPRSFAWVNASWGNAGPYFRLRTRSMAEWRRLQADVPGLPVAWRGGLLWDLPPAELDAYAAEHASWGYGVRRVDRTEAARIEPQLAEPPAFALHVAEEGAVEPLAATRMLVASATASGASVAQDTRVLGLDRRGDRIAGVVTAAGTIEADEVVVAAGAATADLLATAGVALPLTAPPGLLVHSRPCPRLLNGLLLAPGLHMRQTAEGRLVAGSEFGGADPGSDPGAVASTLFARMQAMLRSGDALAFDFHTVGYRPLPADGFPAIGRPVGIDGLYAAVTHSGITLAPALGLFAAQEILAGRRDPLLEPYGFGRFAETEAAVRRP